MAPEIDDWKILFFSGSSFRVPCYVNFSRVCLLFGLVIGTLIIDTQADLHRQLRQGQFAMGYCLLWSNMVYLCLWFELNSVNLSSVSSKTSESICPFWRNSRKTRIRPFDLLWACLGLSKVGRATSYSDPRRFGGRNWQIEIFDIMMYDFHDMMLPPKPAVMNSEYEGNSCLEFFSGICFPFWTLFLNMMIQERLSEWSQLTWL